jgi:hypothetical protein
MSNALKNFPVRWTGTSASLLVSCEGDLSFPVVINLEIDSKQSKIVLVQVNSIQANFFLLSRHSASLEKICLLTGYKLVLALVGKKVRKK